MRLNKKIYYGICIFTSFFNINGVNYVKRISSPMHHIVKKSKKRLSLLKKYNIPLMKFPATDRFNNNETLALSTQKQLKLCIPSALLILERTAQGQMPPEITLYLEDNY
ncbi:hypothetical protein HYV10_03810 [Candidatus Dependentiae bacterium]|nr:hypothetical protein [Candidatus Dependentiae bacterium]